MFDHSSVGRSITLPSGEINVNQALCEMLGYTQDEIKNCKWQEITHPDDVELTQNEVDALISGKKESVRFIKRYIHKSGSVIWGDVGSVLRWDKDGKPLYFISTIMDITERKLAEEALRISEEKWRTLVNASPDYIALHDPEGRYLFLNHYAKGFNEKDVIGTSLYQYLLPESVELFRSNMEKALQAWVVQHFVMAALGDDGSLRTYDEYLVPLHGKGPEIYTLAVARDITELKQAEAALRQKMNELERFQRLTVGRELRMIEMKKEINALLVQSGQPEKYPLPLESHSERSR
jgi:PAS domain S-box-containing protein